MSFFQVDCLDGAAVGGLAARGLYGGGYFVDQHFCRVRALGHLKDLRANLDAQAARDAAIVHGCFHVSTPL